jgi:hypothetical protein
MDYIKVKDHPNLVRDKNTKAVLTIDNSSLNKYKKERQKLMKINNSLNEIDDIKGELSDIREMLTELTKIVRRLDK